MRSFSVFERVMAAICTSLFCLGVFSAALVLGAEANETSVQKYVTQSTGTGTEVCSTKPINLNGEKQTFKFKCADGAKLEPVEQVSEGRRADNLTSVYQFTPTSSQSKTAGDCVTSSPGVLNDLVPGSSLKKAEASGHASGMMLQQTSPSPEFELTIGEAEQDTHLCYICRSPAEAGGGVPGRGQAGKACTVFVTVPQKQKPPVDSPSDSGSLSPSGFGWLTLSITGCALGLIFRP